MKLNVNYETTEQDGKDPIPEQTYWNSWDGEIFTVIDISDETATVMFHNDSSVELVEKDSLTVDYERIHPLKTEGVNIAEGF